MTLNEFSALYDFHDSLIDSITVDKENSRIIMVSDFAFWMQKGFKEGDPETGSLVISFHSVSEYSLPDNIPYEEVSILGLTVENGAAKFTILNDITDDCFDILIKADSVTVRIP